ncbi:myosin-J heavy chain isoform X2 [Kryptolebias marmoratus]|uniref:myosin-J heavy chain isoform X2 n=1 Tax=Kryptolebias marmoratus TaxID=37003 RepID=UPI0018AC93AD|nr:myosin-J heavy chain isoform X2 [Kryptolebias marmoratus]
MADQTGFVDKEKSLFLTQILYLEEQLERCQLTYKELEKQKNDLASQYSALEKSKKETTERLKGLIGAKEKKVEDLSAQLEEQQRSAEQHREFLQQQHQQLKQELLELIDECHLKQPKLAAVLAEKKKQMMDLKQQVSELEAMKKQLVDLPEEQEAEIHSLKMKMESDCQKLDENLQRKIERFVPTNISLMLEMERDMKSKQTEKLLFLLNLESSQSEELGILKDRQKDLDSSKQDLINEIDSLIQQKTAFEKEADQLKLTFRQLIAEREEYLRNQSSAQNEAETLRQSLTEANKEYYHKVAMIGRLEAELQKETNRRRQLEGVRQKAAIIVKHILQDPDKASEAQWKRGGVCAG